MWQTARGSGKGLQRWWTDRNDVESVFAFWWPVAKQSREASQIEDTRITISKSFIADKTVKRNTDAGKLSLEQMSKILKFALQISYPPPFRPQIKVFQNIWSADSRFNARITTSRTKILECFCSQSYRQEANSQNPPTCSRRPRRGRGIFIWLQIWPTITVFSDSPDGVMVSK